MGTPVSVALDAMSGDLGHEVVVDAALSVLDEQPELSLVLVGDERLLRATLGSRRNRHGDRISVRHTTQVVAMDELPSRALRAKKDSSMRVAIDLVREGKAQACVSAGNTGALMAIARFVLKTLPGIDRPAIISAIPNAHGHTHMLDLGANAECTAEQLFQFAVMGAVLARAVHGLEQPRVGLLNIGEEEIKGNEQIKQAAALIQKSSLNYIGYVEGDDVYLGEVDVVVCDGFVGNVALKTSEGVAKLIRRFMEAEFRRNALTRLAGLAALPVLKSFGRRIDPRHYNGASLVGLKGVVIKSHGGADEVAFANAIRVAVLEVRKAVPARISSLLESALGARPDGTIEAGNGAAPEAAL
jgi:phosphate acyltransferase